MNYYIIELPKTSDTQYYQVRVNNQDLIILTFIEAVKYVGSMIKPNDTCTDVYLSKEGKSFSIHLSYLNFMARPALKW